MTDLIVLGTAGDYNRVDVSPGKLKTAMDVLSRRDIDITELLRDENVKISSLRNYGGTVSIKESSSGGETTPNCLLRLLGMARAYGSRHNAEYVLVQDLRIDKGHTTSEISASIQMCKPN